MIHLADENHAKHRNRGDEQDEDAPIVDHIDCYRPDGRESSADHQRVAASVVCTERPRSFS